MTPLAAPDHRVRVSPQAQLLKGQQVAFESLGRRKFMYNAETGVLLLGPKTAGRDDPAPAFISGVPNRADPHAVLFADLNAPGNYDDYVRGAFEGDYMIGSDRINVKIYGFTGGGGYEGASKTYYGREERGIDNQLRTLQYLVKAGAPPDTKISIVAGFGALDTDNFGDLFPESYPGLKRKRAA